MLILIDYYYFRKLNIQFSSVNLTLVQLIQFNFSSINSI